MRLSVQNSNEVKKREAALRRQTDVNKYPFDQLGKDHGREVAGRKEQERAKRREAIGRQLTELEEKKRSIAKAMQSRCKGTLEVPSSSVVERPSRKLEYKKLLLNQIELDRERRKLEKEIEGLRDPGCFWSRTRLGAAPEAAAVTSRVYILNRDQAIGNGEDLGEGADGAHCASSVLVRYLPGQRPADRIFLVQKSLAMRQPTF